MENRRNEVLIKDKTIKEIDLNLNKVIKSVYKVKYNNRVGTGFLIKLNKDQKELNCLMTNEHVITKEMIESNEIIEIENKSDEKLIKINLDKNERFIIYNEEMDISIIEIKIDDNINDKCFLLPNLDNYMEYIDKDIYIVQYPLGKNISYSEGKIKNIKNEELIYDASTKLGSSGSPILIKNTIEVIGIHKQGCDEKTENYGILLYSIIQLLNSKNKNFINDDFYIEDILNDEPQNKGKTYYNDCSTKYEGELFNGNPHGNGKLYYKNGKLRYEGQFVNGKKEGKGIYYYKNGNYYKGQWLNDHKNGKGILYYQKDNIKYDGEFVNGKFEGTGKYIWKDGQYYIGDMLNHKKHGKGIIYYKNGNNKYDGEFENDKKEGNGKYYWKDGEYYKGQWKNDHKHGKGILYYKNGNIKYEDEFVNGKKKERENIQIKMVIIILDIGQKIKKMVKENYVLKIIIFYMKEILSMISFKGLENI